MDTTQTSQSSNNPTRFISMTASSLDTTLNLPDTPYQLRTSCNINKQQQQRYQKQYIDPNQMNNFENDMNRLGFEFEHARRNLGFSTNSLQSKLNNNQTNFNTTSFTNHTTNTQNIFPNITTTPLPNTSIPLPPSNNTSTTHNAEISSIGDAIDERLQNLKAKLFKLEQEDFEEKKLNSNYTTNHRQNNINISNENVKKKQNIDHNKHKIKTNILSNSCQQSSPILYTNKHQSKTTTTAISLPNINSSFSTKYAEYMRKYHHGSTQRHQRHTNDATSSSFPDYDYTHKSQSKQHAQSLLNKYTEKSKALFATNIDYTNNQQKKKIKNDNKRKKYPYIDDKELYNQTISSFDDQLNSTWNKTQLQIKRIKSMNHHFKKSTNNINDIHQSIASSHWTLDSQSHHLLASSKDINNIMTLNVLNEDTLLDKSTSKSSSIQTIPAIPTNTNTIAVNNNVAVQTDCNDKKPEPNTINLSFERGIQVKIPTVCKYCNQNMDTNEVAVITLQKTKHQNQNECTMETLNAECIDDDEEKYNRNHKFQRNCYKKQNDNPLYSVVTSVSQSSSTSFTSSIMSEHDRKRLIMDLNSIDNDNNKHINNYSDCRSDGVLFDQRQTRRHNKNKFAQNILNSNKHNNKKQNLSLRSKVNGLKSNIYNKHRPYNRYKNESECAYLKRKLKLYEEKLKHIDPTFSIEYK